MPPEPDPLRCRLSAITSKCRPACKAASTRSAISTACTAATEEVIGEAARVADELGVPLGVLVFEPHPQQFFFPDRPFFRLTPFRAKARLLEKLGVDILAALPFVHVAEVRTGIRARRAAIAVPADGRPRRLDRRGSAEARLFLHPSANFGAGRPGAARRSCSAIGGRSRRIFTRAINAAAPSAFRPPTCRSRIMAAARALRRLCW